MKKIVMGLDFYNQSITGGVAKTLIESARKCDSDHVPCVLIETIEKVLNGGREENDNRIWTCDKRKRRSMDNA